MLFYEGRFESERLEFGLSDDDVDVANLPDHACGASDMVRVFGEIGAHPVSEDFGLADVEDLAAIAAHDVDAGFRRDGVEDFLELVFIYAGNGHYVKCIIKYC